MQSDETAKGTDAIGLGVEIAVHDKAKWHAHYKLEKFHGTEAEGNLAPVPYAVLESDGNLLTNVGIQLMEELLIGAGGTVYNNANAYIAVGTDATAADAGDTTLTAENDRQGMVATYPSRAGQVLTFKSSFATAASNGVWAEVGIFNDPTLDTGEMLNHKVEALGTKTTGTWNLTITITIS